MRCYLLTIFLSTLLAPFSVLAEDPRSSASNAESPERKVAELERRVAELLAEIQDLRRQLETQRQADAVSWGEIKGGLQAGLVLRPADKRSYEVGDMATFVVKLRNTTDHPIEMLYLAVEPAARIGPSVLDAAGKRPAMSGPVFSSVGGRAISKLSLAAGEEVEFATAKLSFGPLDEPRAKPQATVQAGLGELRVSYNVYYLNADETGNYLTTGEVKAEVVPMRDKQP